MKKSATIAALTALTLSLGVANATTPPVTPQASTPHVGSTPDEATEMRKAQHALENAENDLLHVAHEYGGHRVKATQAITTALQELKQAQQQPDKK